MNEAQRKAIQDAIGAVEDNLVRARIAQRNDPGWVSGNGEPIAEIIAEYERRLKELKEGY